MLGADDKRLHIFITIARDGDAVATLEQMLLHVDMAAGKTCPAAPAVLDQLFAIRDAHASLPRPAGTGRHIGQGKS